MGYRLLVALVAVFCLAGCSALDTDNTPYEGMNPGDPIPGLGSTGGIYAGYYAGDMTAETNTCQSVSDEVGAAVDFDVEIMHADTQIEAIFDEDVRVAGTLDGENVTLVAITMGVEHVYRFTFADGGISGTAEVIEMDEAGQYGAPCATYAVSLAKGEKPAEEVGEDVDSDGGSDDDGSNDGDEATALRYRPQYK